MADNLNFLDLEDDPNLSDSLVDGLNAMAAADMGLSAADVMQRIEEVVAQLVADSVDGLVPTMQLLSRGRTDATLAQDGAAGGGDGPVVLTLRSRERTRDILHNQGASAFTFARGGKVATRLNQCLHTCLTVGLQHIRRVTMHASRFSQCCTTALTRALPTRAQTADLPIIL